MQEKISRAPRTGKRRNAQKARGVATCLRALGLYGLDHLDAVVLAALASEAPLLLIGAHGSAKSALLNRTAQVLGLEHRHYNASLVSFDDLLGFPVPNAARDGLQYLRTPATLWGAQSVFLDEISRCRPEVQNKLFSIVHERRVMGLALDELRYRWAAMNPPAAFADSGEFDDAYLGSQPLDPALADRFPFIVALPGIAEMSSKDRRRLIAEGDRAPPSESGALALLLGEAQRQAGLSQEAYDGWVVGWVDSLISPLVEAGWPVSGRRAAMLRSAAHAVHGARISLGLAQAQIADSALDALRWGLPQRAQGRPIPESKLLAVHRQAVALAGEMVGSPLARLAAEPDVVKRVALALEMPDGTLSRTAFSSLVTDACAAQDAAGRYLLARHLLPALALRDAVNAPTMELIAEPMGKVVDFERDSSHQLQLTRRELQSFNAMLAVIARFDPDDERQASLGNLLYTVFVVERVDADANELLVRDAELERLFVKVAA